MRLLLPGTPAVEYVGELDRVVMSDGQTRVARGALGIVEGVGLITSWSREALEAGLFYGPSGASYAPARLVYYRRRRGPPNPGSFWKHELHGTGVRFERGAVPVFRAQGSVARICPRLPDSFICEG